MIFQFDAPIIGGKDRKRKENERENGKTELKPVYLFAYCYVTGFKEDDFLCRADLQKVNQ